MWKKVDLKKEFEPARFDEAEEGDPNNRINNFSNWEAAKLFCKRSLAKEKFCIKVVAINSGHFDMAPCLGNFLLLYSSRSLNRVPQYGLV